jgi:hypothetical protein
VLKQLWAHLSTRFGINKPGPKAVRRLGAWARQDPLAGATQPNPDCARKGISTEISARSASRQTHRVANIRG